MIEEREEIETYGRVRDWKPIIRVLMFSLILLVFVVVLTIAQSAILADVSEREAEGNSEDEETVQKKATIKISDGKAVINEGAGEVRFEPINYDISDLLESEMIQDLPKNGIISLKIGEDFYKVSRDSVVSGKPSNPDLTISLPPRYAQQLSLGLCQIVKNANANGDLGIETHISRTYLMWKYKGMLKYQDCLS